MKIIRQGDIVLRERKQGLGIHISLLENTLSMKGETGKDHLITAQKVFQRIDGSTQVLVEEEGRMEHEEHAPIKLSSGVYDVDRTRSYSTEGTRRVMD